MSDTIRSSAYFLDASTGALKDNTVGAITEQVMRDLVLSSYCPQGFIGGRLTLESGVPISLTDQTAKGTLYYTPFVHNLIGIYDGTSWTLRKFTELSLSLTVTSGKNYDVFLYDNSGTLTMELSAAWTNDTTRADALAQQDGAWIKSGAATRRWLGTIRASATNQTEFSSLNRFVANAFNQVPVALSVRDNNSHTYTTASWRQWRATATNQIAFVLPWASGVSGTLQVYFTNANTGVNAYTAFTVDSTGAPLNVDYITREPGYSGTIIGNSSQTKHDHLAAGYHFYYAQQYGTTSVTFFDMRISAKIWI